SSTATNSPSPYPLEASKAKAWPTIGESHCASAMSGNPTASSPSKEKRRSPPSQTRSNTSPHASPTVTTPPSPQRTSLNRSYRRASPQFASASPTSSHDPAWADTPTPEESKNSVRPAERACQRVRDTGAVGCRVRAGALGEVEQLRA